MIGDQKLFFYVQPPKLEIDQGLAGFEDSICQFSHRNEFLIRTLESTIFFKNISGQTRDEQMFRCSLKFILYIFLSILVIS